MPTCQKCGEKWSWKETLKVQFTLQHAKPCPYCGADQFVSRKTRNRSYVTTLIALLIIFTLNFTIGLSIVYILIVVAMIPLFIILYPFLIEFSNEDEFS